jgi:DNA polymerase III subunit gamma/tau
VPLSVPNAVIIPPLKTSSKTLLVNADILSQLKGGVSIKQGHSSQKSTAAETIISEAETKSQQFDNQEFNEESLKTIWKQFSEIKKAEKDMNFAMTLSKHEPRLVSDTLINYELDNEAQLELMKDHKKELLDFLRINLKNRDIAIDFVMADENKANSRLYSPSDKFKFLAEKNPVLLELQRRLDLNLDF